MSTLYCGRRTCTVSAERVLVNGILADPHGWSSVTVSGQPMRNVRCCPACTDAVTRLLDGNLYLARPL